jgi:hypothetical protein
VEGTLDGQPMACAGEDREQIQGPALP